MWINRILEKTLQEVAWSFPVIVLTGPRQVGKTSLVRKLFSDHRYVSLDSGLNAEMAETRPSEFLNKHAPPVILDEVQYAPKVLRWIKSYVDERKENGQIIITGSQSFPLMQSVTESLAGRAAVIPLMSLAAEEWQRGWKGGSALPSSATVAGKDDWKRFLWKGGFPAMWADDDASPQRDYWYQSYLATYLERDVRQLMNVGSLRDFERFLRACAARTGQTLNMSELGRDVGVSTGTIRNWISVLQASGQIFLLEPYFRSLGKRLVKSPKLYFVDTGLAAFLTGISDPEALWTSRLSGHFFENHVIVQWWRWKHWCEPSASLWYWRVPDGREVDLVIEVNGKLIPCECKLAEKPSRKSIEGIRHFESFYGKEMVGKAYVACTSDEVYMIDKNVEARPGWTPWSLNQERFGEE